MAVLVTELPRTFEHQFFINVMTYRLKSAIYQGQQLALTHFILKLVQMSCSQFLIISSNQSVSIKK